MPNKKVRTGMDHEAYEWWRTEGIYIDPDTEDVDWHDKRGDLAQMAFIAGWKAAELNQRGK